MKIRSVKAHVLYHRLDQAFDSAFSTFAERWACLVEITCDDGTVGWGECLGPARPNAAMVEAMAELMIGRNPLDIEPIWSHVYGQFRDQGQRGLTMTAQSGIDIALWDIAGKHFGVPVYRLLGGAFRSSVPAYATGGFRPVGRDRFEALEEEILRYREEGFAGVKIKIGFGLREDVRAIELARKLLGPSVSLMIDANHGYDVIEAVRLGQAVAHLDIDWFEEPVVPEQLEAYREVRQRQPIPVAGGETWHGRSGHMAALSARAVDVLQPDVCGCGGITEIPKIAAMAETSGIRLVPHVWGTGIAVAAALQVLAVLPPSPMRHAPNDPWLEFDQTENPFRMDVLTKPILHQRGRISIPDRPGLGVGVDQEALAKWAFNRDR